MELTAAIDARFDDDPDLLSDDDLHARMLENERESQRFEAVKARDLAVWEARKVWASDGSKAPGARLARDAHRSESATRAEVRRAKGLRTMPLVRAAFGRAAIATEHVDLLAQANTPRLAAAFAEAEPMLLGWAIDFAYPDFATSLATWIQVADDDAAEDRAQKQRDGRRAECARTLGGARDVRAVQDPISGEIFEQELFRLERLEFEADWAVAKETHGEQTQLDHLARTSPQRRADALVEMAKRSAAVPADAKQGRILCSVVIDHPTFTGRMCELLDRTPLTPGSLLPHLADIDVERLVFDGASRVLDVGRRTPFFTGALRRAIEVRDRHCQFPGCTVPAERCDVDHIVERCNGGETTQENGRLLCGVHNRQRPGRRTPGSDPPPPWEQLDLGVDLDTAYEASIDQAPERIADEATDDRPERDPGP